jgi:hypothetical protein
MVIAQIVDRLRESRASHDASSLPPESGLYALYLRDPGSKCGLVVPKDGLIYVGRSDNLRKRDTSQHFRSEETSSSTVRRSVGAIFKRSWRLIAEPRNYGRRDGDFTHYQFDRTGETKLTEWMLANIDIGYCAETDAASQESDVISNLEPPLNLQGWDNPQRPRIKRLRKRCANEARRNHRRESS